MKTRRTLLLVLMLGGAGPSAAYEVNDGHFHITNDVQQGTEIRKFLEFMGDKVGRVALFGIPLQQTWAYENSGNYAPTFDAARRKVRAWERTHLN